MQAVLTSHPLHEGLPDSFVHEFVSWGHPLYFASPSPTAVFPWSLILTKPRLQVFPDSCLPSWPTLGLARGHLSQFSSVQQEKELREGWGSPRCGCVRGPESSPGQRHPDVQRCLWAPLPAETRGSYFPTWSLGDREREQGRNQSGHPDQGFPSHWALCLLSLPLHVPTSWWPFSLATKYIFDCMSVWMGEDIFAAFF